MWKEKFKPCKSSTKCTFGMENKNQLRTKVKNKYKNLEVDHRKENISLKKENIRHLKIKI